MTSYPVKIQMSEKAKDELHRCEYGSYEDHILRDGSRLDRYADGRLHIVELIERSPYKTVVYLENEEEVYEFWVQSCTGVFGLHHCGVCMRIFDELEPLISEDYRNNKYNPTRDRIGF